MQPSPQRIAEIQAALKAHGYDPGATWEETQKVCRKIADEHQWQTDHAPDARVLILLGLGGPHSDPDVAQTKGGRLDQDQRAEAARQSQILAHRVQNPTVRIASSRPAATRLSAATREDASAKGPAKSEKRKTARKGIRKSKPKPALAAMPRATAAETSVS